MFIGERNETAKKHSAEIRLKEMSCLYRSLVKLVKV